MTCEEIIGIQTDDLFFIFLAKQRGMQCIVNFYNICRNGEVLEHDHLV